MSETKLILPARDGYDRWAPFYDSKANPVVSLKQREIRRLMGDVRGLRVADLGCGTGVNAVWMAEQGAEVSGVDLSPGMLAEARAKPGAGKVRWIEQSLEKPLPLGDDSFDRVLCSLALEHVENLAHSFGEMARIVQPGGQIAVVEMHPAMLLKGVSAHFHDPKTGQDVRPRSVGHQISDFLTAALGAGLTLTEVTEHLDRGKHAGWPLLLTMRFAVSSASPADQRAES